MGDSCPMKYPVKLLCGDLFPELEKVAQRVLRNRGELLSASIELLSGLPEKGECSEVESAAWNGLCSSEVGEELERLTGDFFSELMKSRPFLDALSRVWAKGLAAELAFRLGKID